MLRRLRKEYGYRFRFRHKTAPVKRVPVIVDREKSPVAAPSSTAGKLTICAIIRDEVPYLQEWIVFHLLRGADHFVIYDNDSCDDPGGVLAPWIARGIVELIPWPSFLAGANAQHMCYGHACRYMSGKTRWLSFLDLDEFLFPLEDM